MKLMTEEEAKRIEDSWKAVKLFYEGVLGVSYKEVVTLFMDAAKKSREALKEVEE